MRVLLAGKATVPKLICPREMHLKDHNLSVLSLAVKKGFQQQLQKFKVPFKNDSCVDFEVEFFFLRTCAALGGRQGQAQAQQRTEGPLDLVVQPNTLKIGAKSQVIMNITAKLKNSYLMQMEQLGDQET